jgi:hypothetical protein
MDIYEAIKTFPSGHHNAPWTPELGSHWPEGQQFTRKPENMQKYMRKKYGLDRTFFNQIGGEEVCISIKTVELSDYLRPVKPEPIRTDTDAPDYHCSTCGFDCKHEINYRKHIAVCDVPLPRIEHTEAGPQTVISDTPARLIPEAGLKPKRAQNQSPLALEMPEIDAKQIKLF